MFVDKEQTLAGRERCVGRDKKERQIKCLSASDRRVAGLDGKTQVREDGLTLMRRPSQEEREKNALAPAELWRFRA
jgi:hypothetical protein